MASDKQIEFWRRLRRQHPALATEFPTTNDFMGMDRNQASRHISAFLAECESRYGFKAGSRRAQIADALHLCDWNRQEAYDFLVERLERDAEYDFTFTRNPTRYERQGGMRNRIPLPLFEQREALRRTIDAVADGKGKSDNRNGSTRPPREEEPREEPREAKEPREEEENTPPTPPRNSTGGMTPAEYLATVRRIRTALQEEATSDPAMALDEIGMRPLEYGAQMYRAGIPFEACLYAMTMHWSPESRQRFGIKEFDPTSFGDRVPGKHVKLAYCLALAKAGVPIMLVGPKGTGKSHLAQDIAEELGLSYGQCPMTAGATPSWLAGKYTMGVEAEIPEMSGETMDDFLALLQALVKVTGSSFVSTELLHAVEHGGVFVFEEMDSADPNMLLLVNNLLANGAFHNPVSGKTIQKHPDFVPIACTNTFGLGADRRYKGREGLDAATLDRWAMGRVFLEIDPALEEEIFYGIVNAEETNGATV